MKKVIMFIIAAMLVTFQANAQKKFTYGIKGGMNNTEVTNLWTNNSNELGFKNADLRRFLNIGAFAEWRIASFFAVSPELVYSGQGIRDKTDNSIFINDIKVGEMKIDSKMNLSYINVPIMLKIYPFKWLSVDFGPQMGLLVAAKTKVDITAKIGGEVQNDKESIDIKDHIETFDFGVGVGLTFNFNKHIFFQPRYYFGLTEVIKNPTDLNDQKHNNLMIQFNLGYRF